ncbi:MAG: beta-ketoacyl synthase chain length factor [Bacteroidales bacterium]|nr:beta-ketoacyl synthase chain length factor [Bacteroidales bacterium]
MLYINGIGSVSIQNGKQLTLPDWGTTNYLRCTEPDFSAFIPPMVARRMSKLIKRSIVASKMCLDDAQIELPDAIISGTGLGCIEETEKFLLSMIEQKETFLQPTHFIQSTHNTISSQIAMNLKCYSYNTTYSHLGTSFESALFDAFLQIKSGQISNALVGGFDEMTPDYKNMLAKIGFVKETPFSFEDFKKSTTKGSVLGEGSNALLLSSEKTKNSYMAIKDMKIFHASNHIADTKKNIAEFLKGNDLTLHDLDGIMMGLNGDHRNDMVYDKIYEEDPLKYVHLVYKHLCGEYFTSAAFGVNMLAQIIQDPKFSRLLLRKYHPTRPLKQILFHNHYQNKSHSLILFEKC